MDEEQQPLLKQEELLLSRTECSAEGISQINFFSFSKIELTAPRWCLGFFSLLVYVGFC